MDIVRDIRCCCDPGLIVGQISQNEGISAGLRLREVVDETENGFISEGNGVIKKDNGFVGEMAFDSEDRGVEFFSQFSTFEPAGDEGLRDRGGKKTWKDRKTWRK